MHKRFDVHLAEIGQSIRRAKTEIALFTAYYSANKPTNLRIPPRHPSQPDPALTPAAPTTAPAPAERRCASLTAADGYATG